MQSKQNEELTKMTNYLKSCQWLGSYHANDDQYDDLRSMGYFVLLGSIVTHDDCTIDYISFGKTEADDAGRKLKVNEDGSIIDVGIYKDGDPKDALHGWAADADDAIKQMPYECADARKDTPMKRRARVWEASCIASGDQASGLEDEIKLCMSMSDDAEMQAAAAYTYARAASLLDMKVELQQLELIALKLRSDGWVISDQHDEVQLKNETVLSRALVESGVVVYCMNGDANGTVYKDIDDCYESVMHGIEDCADPSAFDESDLPEAFGIDYGLRGMSSVDCVSELYDFYALELSEDE